MIHYNWLAIATFLEWVCCNLYIVRLDQLQTHMLAKGIQLGPPKCVFLLVGVVWVITAMYISVQLS